MFACYKFPMVEACKKRFSNARHYILLLIINDEIFANVLIVYRVSSVTVDFTHQRLVTGSAAERQLKC